MRVSLVPRTLFAAVVLGAPSSVVAQLPAPARFTIAGSVIDTLGKPVPFANVFVFGRDEGTIADDIGLFRLDNLRLEKTRFAVRRIGYDPVYFDVDVPVVATVNLQIRMRANVRILPTVDVLFKDERGPLRNEGFYDRMAAGHGLFVTPEMIAAIRPVRATDAFASIPNVVVHRRGTRTRITSSANMLCEYGLVVDKIRVGMAGSRVQTTTPDDLVSGTDLYAIEVYPRNRGLPAQFMGMTQEDGCGTIVVWTKGFLPR